MTPLRLALLSLARRRTATTIALLAIAFPVAAGGALLRLYRASEQRYSSLDRSFDAVVGAKAGELDLLLGALNGDGEVVPEPITLNLYNTIRANAIAGLSPPNAAQPRFLSSLIPITVFARFHGRRVIASDVSFWQRPAPEPSPVFISGRAPTTTTEVSLSEALAKAEGLHLGDQISVDPWVSRSNSSNAALAKLSLRVVGITKATGAFWDQVLVADLRLATEVLARLPSSELHSAWKEHITHYLLANCLHGDCATLKDLINQATVAQMIEVKPAVAKLRRLLGQGQRMGLVITTMILTLGALAVAGMMLTRFDAMRGQLAVLRAIGYGRREVALWLLLEGLLLGTTATLCGAALDGASFPWLRHLTQSWAPTAVGLDLPLLSSAPVWAAAIAATLVAACLPLLRLLRQDIHRTLRS